MLSEKVVVVKSKKSPLKAKLSKSINSSKQVLNGADKTLNKNVKQKVVGSKTVAKQTDLEITKRKRGRPNKLDLLRERFRRGRPRKEVVIARALLEEKKNLILSNISIIPKSK